MQMAAAPAGLAVLAGRAGPGESGRLFVPWQLERSWSAAELLTLARSGYRGIRMTEPVALGGPDGVDFVRLLREAAAAGLRVRWHGQVPAGLTAGLRHLSPPYQPHTDRFAWRRPGSAGLTIRYGPGFAVIEDRRAGRYQRSVLHERDSRYLLLREAEDRVRPGRYECLIEAGLAIRLGGWATSLVIHPRRPA